MKTLLIVRHAKTEIGFGMKDFDRALNERGLSDAPMMAKRIAEKNLQIDAFISSPAKRAKQTAELFCGSLNYKKESIIFVDKLYHAPSKVFYEVIENMDAKFSSAAIFSHNPGITDFVSNLTDKLNIANMPTCAIFAVKADIKTWKDFSSAKKDFLFFDYPKKDI